MTTGVGATSIAISVAIMCHPSRAEQARLLVTRHPELRARVIEDPDPTGPPSAIRTAALAWGAADPAASHHLVLQDDAALTGDFVRQAITAISARPDALVSFFAHWISRSSYAVRLAALRGTYWAAVVSDKVPTVAAALPTERAIGFARYLESACGPGDHDDVVIHKYLTSLDVPLLITVPNLADHLPVPSVAGHDFLGERSSVCFPPETDPDFFAASPLLPTFTPHLDPRDGAANCYLRRDPHGFDWAVVPTEVALADRGYDLTGSRPAAHAEAADPALVRFWQTAFALGVALRESMRESPDESVGAAGAGRDAAAEFDVDAALARPLARMSLDSLITGIMRTPALRADLGRHADALPNLLREGVRTGYHQAG